MAYETFPHEADMGIRGFGPSVEKAFEEAAKAMFDVEVDVEKVEASKKIEVKCEASNIKELFVEWLNALLAQASIEDMVFSSFKVKKIEKIEKNKIMKLEGEALGEKLQPEKHNVKNEIKGATYAQLKVNYDKIKKQWIAQCIVDV